ncbi:MAG: chalcone isomerase family protein [Terrimicrobiaceae bacterium]
MKFFPIYPALFLSVLFTLPLQALTIQGVEVAPQKEVSGQTLPLNGAGLRTVTLAFIPIKAYVASFYSPQPLRSYEAVLASPGPLQFNFTFLQGVSQKQVADAWTAQFKQSTSFTYPGLAKDQVTFVGFFGPLKKGGIETVEIEGSETRAYDNGTLRGTIQGRNFQKAFLSLWFGSSPVQDSLKSDLLGK